MGGRLSREGDLSYKRQTEAVVEGDLREGDLRQVEALKGRLRAAGGRLSVTPCTLASTASAGRLHPLASSAGPGADDHAGLLDGPGADLVPLQLICYTKDG